MSYGTSSAGAATPALQALEVKAVSSVVKRGEGTQAGLRRRIRRVDVPDDWDAVQLAANSDDSHAGDGISGKTLKPDDCRRLLVALRRFVCRQVQNR